MLQAFFKSNEMQRFSASVKSLPPVLGRSLLSGVSVKGGSVTLKMYSEILPSDDVTAAKKMFLTQPDILASFDENISNWDSTIKSSLAFGIKITDNNVSEYYHIKFGKKKPAFSKLLQFMHIPSCGSGISGEYKQGDFIEKDYAYVRDFTGICQLIEYKFRGQYDTNLIEELELYQTPDNVTKINVVCHYQEKLAQEFCTTFIENIPCFSTRHSCEAVTSFFKHKFEVSPLYCGKTSNGVVSLYFSLTANPQLFYRASEV